jgi:hypothetical protein
VVISPHEGTVQTVAVSGQALRLIGKGVRDGLAGQAVLGAWSSEQN